MVQYINISCRLLDMGYEKDVSKIITAVNNQGDHIKRQTVLLSATLTEGQSYNILTNCIILKLL